MLPMVAGTRELSSASAQRPLCQDRETDCQRAGALRGTILSKAFRLLKSNYQNIQHAHMHWAYGQVVNQILSGGMPVRAPSMLVTGDGKVSRTGTQPAGMVATFINGPASQNPWPSWQLLRGKVGA